MGNPKQKWTAEEEQALRDGVAKHGAGRWKNIHNDAAFSDILRSRSNIDLKDKWRNLNAAAQGLTTSRSKNPKPKLPDITPSAPSPTVNIQPPPPAPDAQKTVVKEEPIKDLGDVKNVPWEDILQMAQEALADAKQNGMDIGSIMTYLEQRIEPPKTCRKTLGGKLRRLVEQNVLEKVENCFRLVETNRPRVSELLHEAAKTAAYKVVEAEETSYLAALSVREVERLSMMHEESDAILKFAQEIYDHWHSNETA